MGFFSSKKKQYTTNEKVNQSEKRDGPAFLSYGAKDRKQAINLAQNLSKEGANIWLDALDIEVGSNWEQSIESAIREAQAFVLLASPSAIESSVVNDEFHIYAELYGYDRIIIVTTGNPELPYRLSNCTAVNLDEGLDKVVIAIKSFLGNSGVKEVKKEEKEVKSKGYIFISYAEEDSIFVELLKEFMKSKGYGYWDYRESNRDYQTLLDNELEVVIKKAEATLSILSNNWKKSDWAKKEYYFSNEIGKPVFLLRFQDMEPSLVTAGLPYIDFSLNHTEGFSKLEIEFQRKNL